MLLRSIRREKIEEFSYSNLGFNLISIGRNLYFERGNVECKVVKRFVVSALNYRLDPNRLER